MVNVYDISTWKKLGFKKLSRKTASTMAVSLDGKYIALGGKDGDVSVAEVKTMEIYHYSKRLHLGQSIASLEFCPSERVMLTTSSEWGEMVTKLTVPKEWKGLLLISFSENMNGTYLGFIHLFLTIIYLFDVQSGRYMHCCFACSWHQ